MEATEIYNVFMDKLEASQVLINENITATYRFKKRDELLNLLNDLKTLFQKKIVFDNKDSNFLIDVQDEILSAKSVTTNANLNQQFQDPSTTEKDNLQSAVNTLQLQMAMLTEQMDKLMDYQMNHNTSKVEKSAKKKTFAEIVTGNLNLNLNDKALKSQEIKDQAESVQITKKEKESNYKKNQPKKNIIRGQNKEKTSLKTTKHSKRYLVKGLTGETTKEELVDFLKENNVNPIQCEKMKTKTGIILKSFFIRIDMDDNIRVMDSLFWPEGVYIVPFEGPHPQHIPWPFQGTPERESTGTALEC